VTQSCCAVNYVGTAGLPGMFLGRPLLCEAFEYRVNETRHGALIPTMGWFRWMDPVEP
jgi:hypothetical protein